MTKSKLAWILIGSALLLEGGVIASAKFNVPPPLVEHPIYGKVELDHCPKPRRVYFDSRPSDLHTFDIPAGEVGQTIPCFNTESGLAESWGGGEDGEDIYKRTAAVKGRMSSLEALTRMLAPTDLEIVPPMTNDKEILYRAKPKAAATQGNGS